MVIQHVRSVGGHRETKGADLCAVAGHAGRVYHGCAVILREPGLERFGHDVERMPRHVQYEFVGVAPVQRQSGIGSIAIDAEHIVALAVVVHLDLGHGVGAIVGNQYGIWPLWHPVVFPVIDQLVKIYRWVPGIHSLPVEPVMILHVAAKILDLVDVVVIGGSEPDLVLWVDGRGVLVRVGDRGLQLIVGPVLTGGGQVLVEVLPCVGIGPAYVSIQACQRAWLYQLIQRAAEEFLIGVGPVESGQVSHRPSYGHTIAVSYHFIVVFAVDW